MTTLPAKGTFPYPENRTVAQVAAERIAAWIALGERIAAKQGGR